jgi:hypothetical protein
MTPQGTQDECLSVNDGGMEAGGVAAKCLLGEGGSAEEVAKIFGVNCSTMYRAIA